MAVALKEGRPVRGVEAIAERPDGTRVPFIPFPTPLFDASGRVTGAINMPGYLTSAQMADARNAADGEFDAMFIRLMPAPSRWRITNGIRPAIPACV